MGCRDSDREFDGWLEKEFVARNYPGTGRVGLGVLINHCGKEIDVGNISCIFGAGSCARRKERMKKKDLHIRRGTPSHPHPVTWNVASVLTNKIE